MKEKRIKKNVCAKRSFRVGRKWNMRKLVTVILTAAASAGLTSVARADLIVTPPATVTLLDLGEVLLLLVLIAILIEGVLYLLRKFRKK